MIQKILLSVVLGFLIFYFMKIVKSVVRFYTFMYKIPGPKTTPILGLLPELFCEDVEFFKKIRKWNRDHGPVFLSSALIFTSANISGPEEFELVASSINHIRKGRIYNILHRWLGTGLLTSTGTQWQTRRKILTPAFHFSILQNFVTIFNKETDKLVEILKKKQGTAVNVMPLISQCTLDSIVETAMGSELDLQNSSDNSYVKAIHELGKALYYRFQRMWLRINWHYYHMNSNGRKEAKLIDSINDFTAKVINKRQKGFEILEEKVDSDEHYVYSSRKKLAMLDLMLNAKLTSGIIDDEGIKDEVNTFLFEGHDTTAMAICFLLMLLANHRKEQDLVYEEITQNLQENQKHFTLKELNDLKYMECVIKEGLRLYPSVPFIARQLDEDIQTKEGLIFPKGCEVFIHIFDIHRNEKHWPEPEKFDPERFLPQNCVNRHPYAYVPFSAGPRNCIGQKFGMLEIKAVLSGILQNFILEPIDTPENLQLVPDIVLRPKDARILVKFIKRQ